MWIQSEKMKFLPENTNQTVNTVCTVRTCLSIAVHNNWPASFVLLNLNPHFMESGWNKMVKIKIKIFKRKQKLIWWERYNTNTLNTPYTLHHWYWPGTKVAVVCTSTRNSNGTMNDGFYYKRWNFVGIKRDGLQLKITMRSCMHMVPQLMAKNWSIKKKWKQCQISQYISGNICCYKLFIPTL